MDAKTANRFYEDNKKYIYDKITILGLALAAMEDAIEEAYDQGPLEGTYYNLDDFQERQASLIFEEVMSLGSYQIAEMSRGNY